MVLVLLEWLYQGQLHQLLGLQQLLLLYHQQFLLLDQFLGHLCFLSLLNLRSCLRLQNSYCLRTCLTPQWRYSSFGHVFIFCFSSVWSVISGMVLFEFFYAQFYAAVSILPSWLMSFSFCRQILILIWILEMMSKMNVPSLVQLNIFLLTSKLVFSFCYRNYIGCPLLVM